MQKAICVFAVAIILKIKLKIPQKAPFSSKNVVKMGKNRYFYEKTKKVPTKFLQFAKKCFFEFLQFEKVSQMFTGIV